MQPDLLIVTYGMNDHIPSFRPATRAAEPRGKLRRALIIRTSQLRLAQLGTIAWERIASLHPPPLSVRWTTPDEYSYNLSRLVEETRERGLRLLFVHMSLRPLEMGENLPAFPGPHQDNVGLLGGTSLADLHRQHQEYANRVKAVAAREKVPLVDMAETFRRGEEAAFGRYDFVHPNTHGAKLTAQTLYATLLELGWLSSSKAPES